MTIISILLAATLAGSPAISGLAVAGDGDSLKIGETRIRLFGIDAPEFDQHCTRSGVSWACGHAAAEQLSKLVTGREVRCAPTGTDAYGRTLARCTVGAIEVNRTMVALGYAVAFRRYSMDYTSAEDAARSAKRGLWSGTFEMPSEVRAAKRQAIQPTPTTRGTAVIRTRSDNRSGACLIKGNHSRKGEWIYHVPGMPYYGPTRAEAMFCSEAEAQAAGYRRARVR